MRLVFSFFVGLLHIVLAFAPTDEYQDADSAQSGYLDNHNLHPATVGSSIFGILWKKTYGVANEMWYAKPLVYTPPGASQLVFLASNANTLRTLDAVNGTVLNIRTVQPPLLSTDMPCGDIPNFVGIIGTPVIDPATNTAYFFSKGYKGGATSGGVINARYLLYAVDVQTLQDKPGFPVLIDGHYADNDITRYFVGGNVLQRPSLVMMNGVIIGAFGGHCDLYNYTGMLVAVSTTPGVGVTSMFAMEAAPGASPAQPNINTQSGGKAGIWQSGMAISVDAATNRIFISTGNGQGHANGDVVASGRSPLSTLDEVVASFIVSPSGKLSLNDYFEPYEYISMDAGDRDLGSSGITLLDPNTFSTKLVSRIAMTGGKNSKVYIMNANNLGGFKQGPGGTDNILQTITLDAPVFGGIGSYPLEGGYMYFTPIGASTVAYKMGVDPSGAPQFTKVGSSVTLGAGRVGIGIPTITTYKGQAGTGILWVTDPSNGLQAFQAVPVNNVLVPIPLPPTGGLTKFIRPAFGDGRVYVSDANGNVVCLGSPVALPLQCTQPVDYGNVNIGTTATKNITCKTLIAITSINGCVTGDLNWRCVNSTLPKGPLAAGANFTFPVTWDLTRVNITDTPNASYGKVQPGVASTALNIYTTNAVAQFSTIYPVSLTGTEVSSGAYLTINPVEVDFGGLVVGSGSAASVLTGSVVISNVGSQVLAINGLAWTPSVDSSDGPVIYTNTSAPNANLGNGFSSNSFPAVGATIAPGGSLTIPLKFSASNVGAYTTFIQLWTTGGSNYVLLSASAATAPVANISVSSPGGYIYQPLIMNFGNVTAGSTQSQNIRICNTGGSALSITKSKPPTDDEIFAPNEATDLHEGQNIDAGTCALGQVTVSPAPLGVNRPARAISGDWILNADDPAFGLHDVAITANVVTRQVGPLLSDGSAKYAYLGCYYDGAGRLFPKSTTNTNNNENGLCQTQCASGGYIFAGTEYRVECWCGNTPPSYTKFTAVSAGKCKMSCSGDTTQACGGDGTYISVYYDRTKYSPGADTIPGFSSSSSAAASSTSSSSSRSSSSSSNSAAASSTTSRSSSSSSNSAAASSTSSSSSISSSSPSSSTTSSSAPSSSSSSSTKSTSSSVSSTSSSVTTPSSAPSTTSTSSSVSSTSSSSSSSTTSTSMSSTSSSTSTSSSSSSVTRSSSTTSTGPTTVPTIGAYSYIGCYTEPNSGRALTGKFFPNDTLTVQACYTACTGFKFFGLEYHRECYCGNVINSGSVVATSGFTCSMTCVGNTSQICGGSVRLSMYQLNSTSSSSSASP